MSQSSTPLIESVKEITRNIIFALFALFMTSGLDIVIQMLSEADLGGVWQIALTGLIQLILRGRDKYKYYKAKKSGEPLNQIVAI